MEETLQLTPEEQESLAIGEELAGQEQEMLAGKFENAEQLEKAYLELQSKLGQRQEQEEEADVQQGNDDDENEGQEVSDLVRATLEAFQNGAELSEDMLSQFDNMSSRDVVNAFKNAPQQQQETPDLSDAEVNAIQNMVGGKSQYDQLISWSSENLPQAATEAFDNLVNIGDASMIQLAVLGLQGAYQQANGYEGNLVTGRQARDPVDVFRSQAEVVQAMQDPRYDSDPAYRDDVFAKLGRSNLDM